MRDFKAFRALLPDFKYFSSDWISFLDLKRSLPTYVLRQAQDYGG